MLALLLVAIISSVQGSTGVTIPFWEMERAHMPKGDPLLADTVEEVHPMLNKALQVGQKGQDFLPCQEFHMRELNVLLQMAYDLKDDRFENIYEPIDDGRKLDFTPESLAAHIRSERSLKLTEEEYVILKAAKCAEFATLFVHHVPEELKSKFRRYVLPLLDEDNLFRVEDYDFLAPYVASGNCLTCHRSD